MFHRRKLEQKTAVITGAAAGIGRALAMALAGAGCNIALVDRASPQRLAEIADAILARAGRSGLRISHHHADVADPGAVNALPSAVLERHAAVDLLINNAGVAHSGSFTGTDPADFERVLRVNFWGQVHCCRSFLPHLAARPDAAIVGVLSDFALIGFPGKTAYAASKFALRGFYASLAMELPPGVGLTTVYPGPTATNLVKSGTAEDPAKQAIEARLLDAGKSADSVARRIVRGLRRRETRIRIGKETFAIDYATRLFPRGSYSLLRRIRRLLPFV